MNRKVGITLFAVLSFVMGAAAGAVVWAVLKIIDLGIVLFWSVLPEAVGAADQALVGTDACGSLLYDVLLCAFGGLLIGLWQRKHGVLPESLEEVIGKVKRDGGYAYDKIPVILVSALLPLCFGGAVGPEAGLTGAIAGICTLVGDKLKYKGDRVKEMSNAGMAAVLGAVFGAPLFGIVGNFEEKDWKRETADHQGRSNGSSGRAFAPKEGRERLVSKPVRLFIYVMAVVGALLVMKGLTTLWGGSEGLPHFAGERSGSMGDLAYQWVWIVPLMAGGILAAVTYVVINRITNRIGSALAEHRIVSCVTAGVLVGIAGHFVGAGRFSGEAQLGVLIKDPTALTAGALLAFCVVKLLMVNVCVNFGWKGGTIFPMIFSASALGFSMAACIQVISGQNLEFAFGAAVAAASMLGFLMRRPVTVVAVLLLCFPLSYIPALAVSSFVSAFLCKCISKCIQRYKRNSNNRRSNS